MGRKKKDNLDLNSHYFIVELLLNPEKWQEDIMNKRFEIGRLIYNALLKKFLNIYNEMIKTKKYRELFESLKNEDCDKDTIWKQINNMTEEYGLTQFAIVKV